jgi:undecaprenyl-diphosphatase
MESLWDVESQIIVVIQSVHNPALDLFFNIITFMGESEFFLLLFPLVIWSINKSIGFRLAYLVLTSYTLNTWAKLIGSHPRPFEWPSVSESPVLRLNEYASGPGIPSGHAQLSLTLWFYLAYRFKKVWLWWLAAILFVLISFSRIYLGVHFPSDVLGGILLGLVILLLFIKFEPKLTALLARQSLTLKIGLAIVGPLIVLTVHPHPDTVAAMSIFMGFSLGAIWEQEKIHYQANGTVAQRLIRYLVGLIPLVLFYEGLDRTLPEPRPVPLSVVQHAVSGFWISGGALWLFQRTIPSQPEAVEPSPANPQADHFTK